MSHASSVFRSRKRERSFWSRDSVVARWKGESGDCKRVAFMVVVVVVVVVDDAPFGTSVDKKRLCFHHPCCFFL